MQLKLRDILGSITTVSENPTSTTIPSLLSEFVASVTVCPLENGFFVSTQTSGDVFDPPVQLQSDSIWHSAEHPSLLSKFPSSHAYMP